MQLKQLRDQIDQINSELVSLLGKRIEIAKEIARIKKRENLPILDSQREDKIKEKVRELAKKQGISPSIMEEIIQIILEYSRIEMEIT